MPALAAGDCANHNNYHCICIHSVIGDIEIRAQRNKEERDNITAVASILLSPP